MEKVVHIRGVTSLEGGSYVVFYNFCAFEIWHYKKGGSGLIMKGGLWREWSYKKGGGATVESVLKSVRQSSGCKEL